MPQRHLSGGNSRSATVDFRPNLEGFLDFGRVCSELAQVASISPEPANALQEPAEYAVNIRLMRRL